jgi:hypothetical protein
LLTIDDLNSLYGEAENADQEMFSEQRSNILLVAGEHYTRKGSRFWNRIRDNRQLSNEQKIRLTKNHIQKITKTYVNNITALAPGVACLAKNKTELQDQKAAELHQSVWQDLKTRHKINKKIREFAEDFVNVGECFVKIFFDPQAGQAIGYSPEVDEMGQPMMDETGNMVQGKPIMSGDFVFERILAFNLLRAREAKDLDTARFFCYRKMVAVKDLQAKLADDPEAERKMKFAEESSKDTYTVFDGSTGNYQSTKGMAMLREYYFRPCADYPKGYFYITTQGGILWEGELPFGIFPIVFCGFDNIPTSPRCRSIIKQLRPYQAEVNRAASKIAEHQITLGDDKLLIQAGTKISHGGQLPGVRGVQYQGMTPTYLPGRAGDQYLEYMQSQIKEMYDIANIAEDSMEKDLQLEPYSLLYRSLKSKKKFSNYTDKFEEFLVSICETSLKLAKNYYSEKNFIPAVGKKELINIQEFKSADDLCYQITVEPQSDDIETKLGKQLVMNHVLQYVGNQLGKDDIGRIMRAMPYTNEEEAFGDLTLDYDNAVNDILALDRGEMPAVNNYDTHPYMIKRLIHRMRQPDFRNLAPQIQQNYAMLLQQHEQMETQQQQQLQAAEAGYIPTGGYLVGCDFYVDDPADPGKTRRARVPYQSLDWLIKRLDQQGMGLEKLEGMQQGALSDMASMMLSQKPASMPAMPVSTGAPIGPNSPLARR